MPFKSKAQRRWAHATAGKPGGMSKAQVKEFESATPKSKKLPARAKAKPKRKSKSKSKK